MKYFTFTRKLFGWIKDFAKSSSHLKHFGHVFANIWPFIAIWISLFWLPLSGGDKFIPLFLSLIIGVFFGLGYLCISEHFRYNSFSWLLLPFCLITGALDTLLSPFIFLSRSKDQIKEMQQKSKKKSALRKALKTAVNLLENGHCKKKIETDLDDDGILEPHEIDALFQEFVRDQLQRETPLDQQHNKTAITEEVSVLRKEVLNDTQAICLGVFTMNTVTDHESGHKENKTKSRLFALKFSLSPVSPKVVSVQCLKCLPGDTISKIEIERTWDELRGGDGITDWEVNFDPRGSLYAERSGIVTEENGSSDGDSEEILATS